MSDITRSHRVTTAWPCFVGWAVALGLLSLVLSVLTVTSRAKLFLGPQTFVLGAVGLAISVAAAFAAWQCARDGTTPLDRPLLSRRGIIVTAIACAIASAAILCFAFAQFPNSADEYGFLFQADTFRHLRLWNAPPPDPALFEQNLIIARDGIWISQYLPGWPAVLALFDLAHLPWLAAPACGALLVLLLWVVLRLECRSPALTVALLLAYATTGFFLLNSATYFSHCISALTVLGSIACMLRTERDGSWWWPAGAGFCCGLALLCRIDSAALAVAAAGAAWLQQGCRWRTLLLGAAGAVPPVVAFATYNWAVTGSPIVPPTAWAGVVGFGPGGIQGVEAAPSHFRMLIQTGWRSGELADTASLLLPALYFAALVWRIRARQWRFYDIIPFVNVTVFLVYPDIGGFQMGPRYWFDGFVVMHVTIGSVFSQLPPRWQRFAVACCLLLVPVSLARLPGEVWFQARVMHERAAVFHLAAALPTNRRSVVLLHDFPSAWNDRANRTSPNLGKDFIRNGIQLDQPVLYARGDVPDALRRACTLYPDAAVFDFRLDRTRPQGWLTPLTCPTPAR